MLELHDRRRTSCRYPCLAILLLLAASSRAAFGQLQPTTLELTDSAGTVVGPVLDFHGPAGVWVPVLIDGHTAILSFGTNSINTPGFLGSGVFFASTDCTGQGFAPNLGPDEFLEPQAVGGPQYTFYAGPPSATTPPPLAFNSVLKPGTTCQDDHGDLMNALPVNPVRTLTPPWQPPFKLVAAPLASSVPAVSSIGLAVLVLALGSLGILLLRSRKRA